MLKIQVFFDFMPCKLLQLDILEPLHSSETSWHGATSEKAQVLINTTVRTSFMRDVHSSVLSVWDVLLSMSCTHSWLTIEIMAQTWFQKGLHHLWVICLHLWEQ